MYSLFWVLHYGLCMYAPITTTIWHLGIFLPISVVFYIVWSYVEMKKVKTENNILFNVLDKTIEVLAQKENKIVDLKNEIKEYKGLLETFNLKN